MCYTPPLTIFTLLSTLISNFSQPIVGTSVMPASAASTNTERKAMSAAPTQPVNPAPTPSAGEPTKVRMCSSADTPVQAKQNSKYHEARKFLSKNQLLAEHTPCTASSLADTMTTLAETYKMPENVAKVMGHMAEALCHTEQHVLSTDPTNVFKDLIKELQSNLSTELDSRLSALEGKLTLPSTEQEQLKSAVKDLGQAAENIKTSISDMGTSIAQVSDMSSQLANTATSYKDTLLQSREQPQQAEAAYGTTPADPRILWDMDRKARQILIDTSDPDIAGASQVAIKEKVSAAIKKITDPPPPQDTTIVEVNKL